MNLTGAASPFLSLPEGIAITCIRAKENSIVVDIACHLPAAPCPECGHSSERIHGSYVRTVADLPCGGRRVILKLAVRKFVCGFSTCPHRIFTERLSELVQSYARMTNRLSQALQTLGFATCGEVGERLAPQLGMQVSGPTLLRRMRMRCYTPPASVRILGIDDWAWKKGQTYGTILVDLESHKPIEVLPDRSTETAEAWLKKHPEVEVVSRDRGGNYAAAARKAAPQAQQIADRFHLLKNLRESLKEFLARKQKTLPEVEDASSDGVPEKARGRKLATEEGWQEVLQEKRFRAMSPHLRQRPVGAVPTITEFRHQVSRENRLARYEAVHTLHEQAFSMQAIAQRLHISTYTVRRFLKAETFPERSSRPYRGSVLDPYKPYLLTRWQQGCFNGAQLYEEIKAQGYTGSASYFRRFVAELRKKHRLAGDSTILTLDPLSATKVTIPDGVDLAPQVKARLSATQASWLCVSQPTKPDERHFQQLELLRHAHPDFEKAYQLSQAFVSMLKERRGEDLDTWLNRAEHSGIAEIQSFAQGLRRDDSAVRAAFSSEWSNGQVEAQVNCLKLQKRIMFGRANFDLLRLRVLCRV